MNQLDKVKLALIDEFANAQSRNPHYSMRAFSKKIGVSQAAISQILAGKRPITRKSAEKILGGLNKDPSEIIEILNSASEKNHIYKSIDMDTYYMIADWYYYAILSLAETKDFESSIEWIAKRLGLSKKTTNDAIDRLLRLQLLAQDSKTKKIKSTGEQFEALSALANPALKKACRQNIELAQKALEDTDFIERDFTAITFCMNPKKMDIAKKMIKTFRRNLCKVMESEDKTEVYKLSIQLFPLTKRGIK